MSQQEQADLLRDVLEAHREARQARVFGLYAVSALPVVLAAWAIVDVLGVEPSNGYVAIGWMCVVLVGWAVVVFVLHRVIPTRPCRTADALVGEPGAGEITAVSSFTNHENTSFTLVHFDGGRRERLENGALAGRLAAATGAPRVRGPRFSF